MATDLANRERDRLQQLRDEIDQARTKILTLQGKPTIQRAWEEPKGLWGILTTVSAVTNGKRIAAIAFFVFLIGGFDATLIRIQLIVPNNDFLNAGTFNQTFTHHGSVMTFLFAVPFLEGVAILLLPLMLGTRTLPWPRLVAFVFWTFLFATLMLETSWLVHYAQLFHILPGLEFGAVPDTGWTLYVPLSNSTYSPNLGTDFFLAATTLVTIGAILAAVALIVTIFKTRAPGMSIRNLPLFAWAILVMSLMILFAFIPQVVANVYLEFDRKFGTHFFDPNGGGSLLLWQHLIWAFGNPDEYIEFIPAAGIISTILPIVLRQRINGYTLLALSFVATAFISFGLWVVHMFTVGLPPLALTFFMSASLVIAIPAGVQVMAWLQTIWRGHLTWNTPFLFMLGFIILFVVGGVSGVLLALIPLDEQLQDSYFVVAHLHYMALAVIVFPMFAAIYYWFPKFSGKLLDERIGKLHFWLMFLGVNLAFFPQFVLGLNGMQRRIYTYPANLGWDPLNLISTLGQFIMLLGVATLIVNLLKTWRKGEKSPPNPWRADTLEWATESPTPSYGFHHLPIAHSRHPLWDEKSQARADEHVTKLVDYLADAPTKWRAQIVVSAFSGEPEQVTRVGSSSILPLLAAMGLSLLFVGFFFQKQVIVALVVFGAVIGVGAVYLWHRRNQRVKATKEEIEEFKREHRAGIYPRGSPTISMWGVAFMILGLGIALATMIFVYFYIRYNAATWPPFGIAQPDVRLPLFGAVLLLASALAMYRAQRAVAREQPAALKWSLAATFGLGIGYLVIQVLSALPRDFTPTTGAYGSVFYSLAVFAPMLTALGVLALIRTQVLAWGGDFTARDHQTLTNNAMYWYFVVVAGLAVAATLYVTPYVG